MIRTLILSLGAIIAGGILWFNIQSSSTPIAWEHGYRTDHIVATRFKNKELGYNISFTFPDAPYNCDAASISDFISTHGGSVYQMGGYPGAPVYAVFQGVTDKETANAKLIDILPEFDKLAASL